VLKGRPENTVCLRYDRGRVIKACQKRGAKLIAAIRQPEIWTGATNCLPEDRAELPSELFCTPELFHSAKTGFAVLEIFGLIGHAGWLKIATLIGSIANSEAIGLVLRLSSRAQEARGAGVAMLALEDASRCITTTAHIEGTGAMGAAMALAGCAQTVIADADDQPAIGCLKADVSYGLRSKTAKQLSADIEIVIRSLATNRGHGLAATVGGLVGIGQLTMSRAQAALAYLNDTRANQ